MGVRWDVGRDALRWQVRCNCSYAKFTHKRAATVAHLIEAVVVGGGGVSQTGVVAQTGGVTQTSGVSQTSRVAQTGGVAELGNGGGGVSVVSDGSGGVSVSGVGGGGVRRVGGGGVADLSDGGGVGSGGGVTVASIGNLQIKFILLKSRIWILAGNENSQIWIMFTLAMGAA